ncbi:hypothetical protein AVEN_195197-1 [Araneus ventricosus]|uniref:Uncharacterized protein n=1 Tax=Araneus ventricosus TaxID=182803 RepID=A0A4Y2P1P6_ARAVE|nr:hypothetical protein AVEN_195197-1 [Araneus ventricosus]
MVLDCVEHYGAATSTTISSFPGPSKPGADEQMEEVRVVLENGSSTLWCWVVSDTTVLPHLPQFRAFPVLQNQEQMNRWRKFE